MTIKQAEYLLSLRNPIPVKVNNKIGNKKHPMRGLLIGIDGRKCIFKPSTHQKGELVQPEIVNLWKSQAGKEIIEKFNNFKESEIKPIVKKVEERLPFKAFIEALPPMNNLLEENMNRESKQVNPPVSHPVNYNENYQHSQINQLQMSNPINQLSMNQPQIRQVDIDLNQLINQKNQLEQQIKSYVENQSRQQIEIKINELENLLNSVTEKRNEIHQFVQLIASQGVNLPVSLQNKLNNLNIKPNSIGIKVRRTRVRALSESEKVRDIIKVLRNHNNEPTDIKTFSQELGLKDGNWSFRCFLRDQTNKGLLEEMKYGNRLCYRLKGGVDEIQR